MEQRNAESWITNDRADSEDIIAEVQVWASVGCFEKIKYLCFLLFFFDLADVSVHLTTRLLISTHNLHFQQTAGR